MRKRRYISPSSKASSLFPARMAAASSALGAPPVVSPHFAQVRTKRVRCAGGSARCVSQKPRAVLGSDDPESSFSVPGASTLEVGDFAKLDLGRTLRTGLPEVVWGPGKTPGQILQIMVALRTRQNAVMATRVEDSVFDAMLALAATGDETVSLRYDPVSKIVQLDGTEDAPKRITVYGRLAVLTAGTADLAVAQEAATTARAMGVDDVVVIADVGVAGLQRLLGKLNEIRNADVVLVVAGMDGALPSVVAGLIDAPVIAVPTSIGYGAAMGGLAPLMATLNSCAVGVTVVNIDNGFGAAMAAVKMMKAGERIARRMSGE